MSFQTYKYKFLFAGISISKTTSISKYDGSSYADLLLELIDNFFDVEATKINIEFNTEEKHIRILTMALE